MERGGILPPFFYLFIHIVSTNVMGVIRLDKGNALISCLEEAFDLLSSVTNEDREHQWRRYDGEVDYQNIVNFIAHEKYREKARQSFSKEVRRLIRDRAAMKKERESTVDLFSDNDFK